MALQTDQHHLLSNNMFYYQQQWASAKRQYLSYPVGNFEVFLLRMGDTLHQWDEI